MLRSPVLCAAAGRAMDAYVVAFELPDYLREDYALSGFPDLNPGTGWRLPIPATFLIDQLGVIRARHLTLTSAVWPSLPTYWPLCAASRRA